ALAAIAFETADEEAVDLHVFRLPLVKGLEAGQPGSEVVDGEAKAAPAQCLDCVRQVVAIGGLAAFGDLDTDVGWGKRRPAGAFEKRRQCLAQRGNALTVEIEEQ